MSTDVEVNAGGTIEGPKVRIFICQDCKQFIPIRYDGPLLPFDKDFLLQKTLENHLHHAVEFNTFFMPMESWDKHQDEAVRVLKEALAGGETGFGSEFYHVAETFKDDAMTCWTQHLRNPACSDYCSDSKRIEPDTAAERKEAGLGKYRSNQFLCFHCPVHQLVLQAKRKKAGLYN